jgi:hypothetical protein
MTEEGTVAGEDKKKNFWGYARCSGQNSNRNAGNSTKGNEEKLWAFWY